MSRLFKATIIIVLTLLASAPAYIHVNGQAEADSYTIYKEGSTYFAFEDRTGTIKYYSNNASETEFYAQEQLNYRGTLTFGKGTFYQDCPLPVYTGLIVEGQGIYTLLKATTNLIGKELIKVGSATREAYKPIIRDLQLHGANLQVTGLNLARSVWGHFSNIWIQRCKNWGVTVATESYSGVNKFPSCFIIENGEVNNPNSGGVLIGSNFEANMNCFDTTEFQGNYGVGIRVGSGNSNKFLVCPIENNWMDGVVIDKWPSAYTYPSLTSFDTCHFELNNSNQTHPSNFVSDIFVGAHCGYTEVDNCFFTGSYVDYAITVYSTAWFFRLTGGRSYHRSAYLVGLGDKCTVSSAINCIY